MYKWTEIEGFHNLYRGFRKQKKDIPEFILPAVQFRSKIKLHGTNAGVVITPDGQVTAQGRSRILTAKDHNFGFATWVAEHEKEFAGLKRSLETLIIYGEWCGPGINKGTALTQLPNKIFAIFAIRLCCDDKDLLQIHPKEIEYVIRPINNAYILPWYNQFEIDFNNEDQIKEEIKKINQAVEEIDTCDPWIKEVFALEGPGEGLVMYPILSDSNPVISERIFRLMFKAKGEQHKVVKSKDPVQINPEKVKSIQEFVELVLTEARLEQGFNELGENVSVKMTGEFLKWVNIDVVKECQGELEVSNLTWDDVKREIGKTAREWFMKRQDVFNIL